MNVLTVRLELSDQFLVGCDLTCGVYADMGDMVELKGVIGFVETEHLIERCDPVGLRRRYLKQFTDMVEATGADPSLGVLQRMKGREKQVAVVMATALAAVDETLSLTHHRGRRPYRGGHCGDFNLVGDVIADKKISHQQMRVAGSGSGVGFSMGSIRTAAALNSAVPDRGSHSGLVSWLTSTSSGKWKVVKVSPSGMSGWMRTEVSIEPRGEWTRTRSPSPRPRRAASAGLTSMLSP